MQSHVPFEMHLGGYRGEAGEIKGKGILETGRRRDTKMQSRWSMQTVGQE